MRRDQCFENEKKTKHSWPLTKLHGGLMTVLVYDAVIIFLLKYYKKIRRLYRPKTGSIVYTF